VYVCVLQELVDKKRLKEMEDDGNRLELWRDGRERQRRTHRGSENIVTDSAVYEPSQARSNPV
jgi:hypothetical protein